MTCVMAVLVFYTKTQFVEVSMQLHINSLGLGTQSAVITNAEQVSDSLQLSAYHSFWSSCQV